MEPKGSLPQLTSVRQLSLSWAIPIQSTYKHPTSWRSILILSAHLRLGLACGLFPSGFPYRPPSPHPYAPQAQLMSFKQPLPLLLLDAVVSNFQPSGKANRVSYWAFSSLCKLWRQIGPARGVWEKGAVLWVGWGGLYPFFEEVIDCLLKLPVAQGSFKIYKSVPDNDGKIFGPAGWSLWDAKRPLAMSCNSAHCKAGIVSLSYVHCAVSSLQWENLK